MSSSSSNLTSAFIDLATYDELEKYMYGGGRATAYFVRRSRKASWFTQIPVVLSSATGSSDFGATPSFQISRAGDYMLHNWLRVTTPEIKWTPATTGSGAQNLRWTRNFMHNLVKSCTIVFNDLQEAKFESAHLDFLTAFTVPQSKRAGYNNMIGNVDVLTNPGVTYDSNDSPCTLPSLTLNLPLPLPHTRDSGVALPTAALPYNEMRINFEFRNWNELLIADELDVTNSFVVSRAATLADITDNVVPKLSNVQLWANYAIVSNSERKLMGAAPRDLLIEQVQIAPNHSVSPAVSSFVSRDIRFSHACKTLFFGAKNTTCPAEHSNYTCASPAAAVKPGGLVANAAALLNFNPALAVDPIATTSLIYENTNRLADMGSDYFSLVQPFYQSADVAIPEETGYHMYSYSLDMLSLDPQGSTNFGKLTNVTLSHTMSAAAVAANADGGFDTTTVVSVPGLVSSDPDDTLQTAGVPTKQTFQLVASVVNSNVVRISGGALGFPVL